MSIGADEHKASVADQYASAPKFAARFSGRESGLKASGNFCEFRN